MCDREVPEPLPSGHTPYARRAVQQLAPAVSFRARTGVLASSFILEAGGFDSPLARPSGPDYPPHCAAL